VFTRLLVGLDGSPEAQSALEQAIVLGQRFHSTLVVAHVREAGEAPMHAAALLAQARARCLAAGVDVQLVEQDVDAETVLAALARSADAAFVGRHGVATTGGDALGATVASLIRTADCCVVVCAGAPSPMRSCAVVFDGQDPSRRALELAARFASIASSTVHIIHATDDPAEGVQVVGVAEAVLSLQRVAFATHIEAGRPGRVIPALLERIRCDALFAGAHLARSNGRPSPVVESHAEEILRGTDIPVLIQP
jgi:nucleotide-binding universal stress UspA family protein